VSGFRGQAKRRRTDVGGASAVYFVFCRGSARSEHFLKLEGEGSDRATEEFAMGKSYGRANCSVHTTRHACSKWSSYMPTEQLNLVGGVRPLWADI
jgi:hypothetical protein